MTTKSPEELRARLVAALTDDPRHSWTCTADRLIVRRTGRTLCKIGITRDHLLVDIIPPKEVASAGASFLSTEPPKDAQGSAWRRALLSTDEELDLLRAWLE